MCEIIGSVPLEILKARQAAARLDKPEVIREIRRFAKLKRDKIVAHKREERRVMQGRFNQIHTKEAR